MMRVVMFGLLVFLVTSCAGGPPRQINIVHKPSGERVSGTYYSGGYDGAMMTRINQLFRDRETGEVHKIDPKLIDMIDNVLGALALPPGTEVELTSGFRSPSRNAKLAQRDRSVARESLHTTGHAADIRIPGVEGKAVAAIARTMQGGGVAYYPKSRHIHVDTGAVRTWAAR